MSWFKLILTALQLIQSWVRWAEEKRLLTEGEKLGLLKAILASADALKLANDLRDAVDKLTPEQKKELGDAWLRD